MSEISTNMLLAELTQREALPNANDHLPLNNVLSTLKIGGGGSTIDSICTKLGIKKELLTPKAVESMKKGAKYLAAGDVLTLTKDFEIKITRNKQKQTFCDLKEGLQDDFQIKPEDRDTLIRKKYDIVESLSIENRIRYAIITNNPKNIATLINGASTDDLHRMVLIIKKLATEGNSTHRNALRIVFTDVNAEGYEINFHGSKVLERYLTAGDLFGDYDRLSFNGTVYSRMKNGDFRSAGGRRLYILEGYKVGTKTTGHDAEIEKEGESAGESLPQVRKLSRKTEKSEAQPKKTPKQEPQATEKVTPPKETRKFEIVGGNTIVIKCGDGSTDKTKDLNDLDQEESKLLMKSVFGKGPGTDLLIALDGGTTKMMKGEFSLANHEGQFQFGRVNKDASGGWDVGVFQIHARSAKGAWKRYNKALEHGAEIARGKGIQVPSLKTLTWGQKDLLSHLGYIDLERGGDETFEKMRDTHFKSKQKVSHLWGSTIQGGNRHAIGKGLIAGLKMKIQFMG